MVLVGKDYKVYLEGKMVEGDIYLVDLPVFRNCLIVWFFGEVFFKGHGLEDAVMPLEGFSMK